MHLTALPIVHLDARAWASSDAEAKPMVSAQLCGGDWPPNQFGVPGGGLHPGRIATSCASTMTTRRALRRFLHGRAFLADHGQRSIESCYGTVLRPV